MNADLLRVINLKKYFPIQKGIFKRSVGAIKAVDGVSFTLREKETIGIVGESGSGKSTLGLTVTRLLEPTSGEIHFFGENFSSLPTHQLRIARQKMQMIFQDPLSSLNPRKTILENVGAALVYHKLVSREAQIELVATLLEQVGLSRSALYLYPHQFSGGQQQRISIGRALALRPRLLVCDEILSALDLSIQAQILNLLLELKAELGLSYLFISHDLAVVRYFADRILVMHEGKIVEEGSREAIFEEPKHPYTKKLLSASLCR